MYENKDDAKKRDEENFEYLTQLWKAWEEWKNAESYFNIADPEFIEYAIFNLESKKKKFDSMLKYANDVLHMDITQAYIVDKSGKGKFDI